MSNSVIWYMIYTENKMFRTTAAKPLTAWAKAFALGLASWAVFRPQRVVVEKWLTTPYSNGPVAP